MSDGLEVGMTVMELGRMAPVESLVWRLAGGGPEEEV